MMVKRKLLQEQRLEKLMVPILTLLEKEIETSLIYKLECLRLILIDWFVKTAHCSLFATALF